MYYIVSHPPRAQLKGMATHSVVHGEFSFFSSLLLYLLTDTFIDSKQTRIVRAMSPPNHPLLATQQTTTRSRLK